MNIRVEVSCAALQNKSGVARYTELLTNALAEKATVRGHYFDFLRRQSSPALTNKVHTEHNTLVPLRVYNKLASINLPIPAFDSFLTPVDLTIHPNFATWPTRRSKLIAAVIHDLTYLYHPELVEAKNLAHLRRVVPRSIMQADFIITVSEAVKAELIKEFHLPAEKCIVTTIPPSKKFIDAGQPLSDIHTKYKLPTKKFILFIGNLEPRKNLATLIRAYRLLPKEIQQEYSLIIGGGTGWNFELTEELLAQGGELGMIRRIGYIDQEDLASFYRLASLFVMPSLYEGFGMPVLEAISSGCPIICADIPVLREAGGTIAHYATALDPIDFAAKMTRQLDATIDPDQAAAHLATFSWEKNAQAIINKTQSLLS